MLMLTIRDRMKARTLALVIILIVITVLVSGCTDILTKQKVGGFGDARTMNSSSTGSSLSPSLTSTGADVLRSGSIYTNCYQSCIQYSKKPAAECDKACCLAACQPKNEDDAKICAASCGYELDKPKRIYS
jgi:hypothetical protein